MTSERNEQDRLLDELLKGCKSPEDILGKHGVLRQMTKRMVEPVFARGSTPNGGFKTGPGEINCTVSCGGISVQPGDVVVGDRDGVVVVPLSQIDDAAA